MDYIETFLSELENEGISCEVEYDSIQVPIENILKLNKRIEVVAEENRLILDRSIDNAARFACNL